MDAPGRVPDSINCHACRSVIDLTGLQPFSHVECSQCGALSVVPMEFSNFLLLSPLGIGGMGTVYKAIDMSLNRYLALKILRPKLAANQQFIDNFSREARAAAAVGHPNIAQVYSFGEVDGQYYLAMELLERGSLDDRMVKLGKLGEKEVLEYGIQIASGLRAAQSRDLLHRDVKPGNILFNDEGVPKIVDFGLARPQQTAEQAASGADSTEPVWGTPYYIAPEKLRGQPEDFRSDIYSLGASLFHALAGRPPFDAATAGEVVTMHATQPVFSLKTYAPLTHDTTARVIGRMLAKNPTERYASYDELIDDFKKAVTAMETVESTTIVAATGERFSIWSIIGTIAGLIICVVVVYFVYKKVVQPQAGTRGNLPSPGQTNLVGSTGTTVPPADPRANDVDFTASAEPWFNAWDVATQQAAQGNFQGALNGYANALPLLTTKPKHREWIFYYEAVILLADNRRSEAENFLVKQAMPLVHTRGFPESITTMNFIDVLVRTLTGDFRPVDLEARIAKMPAWAAGLSYLTAGLKHREAGNFQQAGQSLRHYTTLEHPDGDKWAFNLRPLAEKLAADCEAAATTLAQIATLQQEEKFEEALNTVHTAGETATWEALKTALNALEAPLQEALKQQQEKRELARLEAERVNRERVERERQQAEQEAKLVQEVEPEVSALNLTYDFAGALAKYAPFEGKIQSGRARQFLDTKLATARLLVEFKKQLAADFTKRPYDAGDLKTRNGSVLTGRLARSTDTQLAFQTKFGDILMDWRDFAPATLLKLAQSYVVAFAATEKPEEQARRYLRMAAFAKTFGLEQAVGNYTKQAITLWPDIQKEVETIIGGSGAAESPPTNP